MSAVFKPFKKAIFITPTCPAGFRDKVTCSVFPSAPPCVFVLTCQKMDRDLYRHTAIEQLFSYGYPQRCFCHFNNTADVCLFVFVYLIQVLINSCTWYGIPSEPCLNKQRNNSITIVTLFFQIWRCKWLTILLNRLWFYYLFLFNWEIFWSVQRLNWMFIMYLLRDRAKRFFKQFGKKCSLKTC